MKRVSVIIPTHDRRALVVQAVRSLLAQDYPAALLEIIVVADRCTDGTIEALRSDFGERVTTMESPGAGPCAALNAGMAVAKGDLVIFLDDEMQVVPGFVSAHVAAHERESGAKTGVTGYSPVVIPKNATRIERYFARIYEDYHRDLGSPYHVHGPRDLNAGNMSLPLRELKDAGGFNESYFFQRNDFELAARLMEQGFIFRYAPDARADQHMSVSGDAMVDRAEPRAQNDVRLAREFPWCRESLPFRRQMHPGGARARWRLIWLARTPAGALLRTMRRLMPQNLALVRYAYAARYAIEAVRSVGGWTEWKAFSREAIA
jgi:glycosyltransferase involved in cell wall biosynthesis